MVHMECGFLALPRPIRERIYWFAGLLVHMDDFLPLDPDHREVHVHKLTRPNFERQRVSKLSNPGKFGWLRETRTLLLPICHLIYAEVVDIVFSTNPLTIEGPYLQRIQKLPLAGLRAMTNLYVNLGVAPCNTWKCCERPRGFGRCGSQSPPPLLDSSSPEGATMLDEWNAAARHLGAHIQPGRLHLHLICDVVDLATARLAAASLSHLPRLASCSIRLARHRDPVIQQLARETALRAVGEEPPLLPRSSFPFLALPAELRHRVLEYTDLVAPLRQVTWGTENGYSIYYRPCDCGQFESVHQLESGRRLYGYDYSSRLRSHYACQFRFCVRYFLRTCFCDLRHSAFSTELPPCRCWSPPTPLFLVSRTVRDDAAFVFFSSNRFILQEETLSRIRPARYPASIFLENIAPADYLRYIRFLEIVFCEFDEYDPLTDPALDDWKRSIIAVQERLNLPNLILRVYMDEEHSPYQFSDFRKKITKEQGMAMQRAYYYMTVPLRSWGGNGLKCMFAHFPYPWSRTKAAFPRISMSPAGRRPRLDSQEKVAERIIMGPEYDSSAHGKYSIQASEWYIDEISRERFRGSE